MAEVNEMTTETAKAAEEAVKVAPEGVANPELVPAAAVEHEGLLVKQAEANSPVLAPPTVSVADVPKGGIGGPSAWLWLGARVAVAHDEGGRQIGILILSGDADAPEVAALHSAAKAASEQGPNRVTLSTPDGEPINVLWGGASAIGREDAAPVVPEPTPPLVAAPLPPAVEVPPAPVAVGVVQPAVPQSLSKQLIMTVTRLMRLGHAQIAAERAELQGAVRSGGRYGQLKSASIADTVLQAIARMQNPIDVGVREEKVLANKGFK